MDKKNIGLEININNSIEQMEKNIYNIFDIYSEVGNGELKYSQAIQLNINNFSFKEDDEIVEVYKFRNERGEILTDSIVIIEIYVPNLIKKWQIKGIESLSDSEKYLLALIIPDVEMSLELANNNDVALEYIKDAVEVSQNNGVLEAYNEELRLKEEKLYEKKDFVISMLKNGIDIDLIVRITKLDINEINKIKEQMKSNSD